MQTEDVGRNGHLHITNCSYELTQTSSGKLFVGLLSLLSS